MRKDKRWLREQGRATDVRSVVAVPLNAQDGALGVLILTSSKLNYFSDAQLQLLSTIANEVAIVIHNAWYAEPEMVAEHGKLGRSEGCFAFSRASHWQVMSRLGGGRMIYADKIA